MTTEQYFKLLKDSNEKIIAAAKRAYEALVDKIRTGTPAQKAVQEVTEQFNAEYSAILAAGIDDVKGLEQAIGDMRIGNLTLSERLYANAREASLVVEGVVLDHRRGIEDARALALELYEGYGFNPDAPLKINPQNDAIPKYMRKALLPDEGVRQDLAKIFARAQTRALRTGALRAAYTELLDAIDTVADGSAADYLDKKLQVAFEEKMRYNAKRIAETELHRAYAVEQAAEIAADTDVIYVQYRMSPAHPVEDICDYFAGVDLYGLGPGIYPKLQAPVAPAHPFCKCVLSKVFDIPEKPVERREDADKAFFNRLGVKDQRKVAGSKAKLEQIQAGKSAWDVHNANIDPRYQVKTVEVAANTP